MYNDIQPPARSQPYSSPNARPYHPSPALPRRPTMLAEGTGGRSQAWQSNASSLNAVPLASSPQVARKEKQEPKKGIHLLLAAGTGQSTKKHLLFLIIAGAIIISSASAATYIFLHHYAPPITPSRTIPAKKYTPPKPTVVASMLSGLPVNPNVNSRPVTAVMVENSLDARPQSGLDQASVVFEAQAEGGVTRFEALYQDTQPNYIGPVRSARPYYIQWMLGFDAAYAHVGGSPDALQDIISWHVKDLNQFYNAGAYERISSRYAPHNVYTSISQLNQVETNKGFTTSTFTGFARKAETPNKTPNATSIDTTFSGFYYNAHYDYDAATNSYKRSEAGAAHMALNKDGSKVQLAPKVVVTMIVPLTSGALDSSGAYYSNYAVIGSGKVYVFQDGVVETGTWTKSSNTGQLGFTDANGKPLALNPGQTWIGAVAADSNVAYK